MSKRKEKISAFLDNDLHSDELMSFSLSSEADDAKVAQRYQMMGDGLRGEISDSSFVDVSHTVREALVDENIAVQQSASMADSKSNKSSAEKSGFFASLFGSSAGLKPVAGMAMAALVAVVMVVTVTGQDNAAMGPVAANANVGAGVGSNIGSNIDMDTQLAVEDKAVNGKDAELNSYINQHLEFATQDTLQGRLPYVRAVSFESKNNR